MTIVQPEVEPQSLAAGTEYVILEQVEAVNALTSDLGKAWQEVATVTARDATQAIKEHLASATEVDGRFIATPARSWKPVSVKTKIALDFGEAS